MIGMMADSKVGALQTHFGKYAYGSILVWGGYGWKSWWGKYWYYVINYNYLD